MNLLVGTDLIRVVRPQARRSNTKIPLALKNYNNKLEDLVIRHRLLEQSGTAHEQACPHMAEAELNKIDTKLKDDILSAERTCQKIKSGQIPFFLEAEIWIRRVQLYKTLLKFHSRHHCNYGNLQRMAHRLGIHNPLELSDNEVLIRLQVCKEQCEYYREHGVTAPVISTNVRTRQRMKGRRKPLLRY